MTEIKIYWEGPFSIDEILEKNGIDSKKYDVKNDDIGLYKIYGSHPLYGDSSLVYIGRTENKNGFKSRLKYRWEIQDGADSNNIQIYLGTIMNDEKKLSEDEIIKNKLIDKAEVLLINALKPAFNSSNIKSALEGFTQERYILHNEGAYRKLPAVLDSKYFWHGWNNFNVVDMLTDESSNLLNKTDGQYYGFECKTKTKLYYSIWFGVDYEIWNNKKVPLTFNIYSDDENIRKKIKDSKKYEYYKYKDNIDLENPFYMEVEFDSNLSPDDLKARFDKKLSELESDIDKILS